MHPKRNNESRAEFIKKIKDIDKDKLVFLDEAGIEDNACGQYGYSPVGEEMLR